MPAASIPHYGGRRGWCICPLVRNDGGRPRRVAKLYLPSGGKYFGSREGHGLTYTSCQESGKGRQAMARPWSRNWNGLEDHSTANEGQGRITMDLIAAG